MSDLLDVIKRSDLEEVMRRHRPTDDGKDGSKERYAYIEWLGIYNAIKELPSVKYDSFCDVPMAEAAEVMRRYKERHEPQNYCDDCLYTDTCDSKEFFWACTEKAIKGKSQTGCAWK